jgi:thioredoxin-like negative regulator of GroEL
VVVTFSAHWCGPCKLLTKQLVATRADLRAAGGAGAGAEFVKVEAPEEEALSSRLGVHQLPCTFFVGAQGRGRPALRMEGLLAAAVIEEAITGKSAVLGSDLRRAIKL